MSWISKEVVFERLLLLFNHLVVPDSLRHHGLQHARLPYPSPSPEVCSSSCPLHWWCHPTISSSDAFFSFCPQAFPASACKHPTLWKWKWSCSVVSLCNPWAVAYKAPPSMEFSRQQYWSGLPYPPLGDLHHSGIEPRSPTLQADTFTIWATREAPTL